MPEPMNFPELIEMPKPPPKNRVRRSTTSPIFLPAETSPEEIAELLPKIDLMSPIDIYVGDDLVLINKLPSAGFEKFLTIRIFVDYLAPGHSLKQFFKIR